MSKGEEFPLVRVCTALSAAAAFAHAVPYAASVVAYWPQASACKALQNLTPDLYGIGRAGHVAITFDDGPHPVGTPKVLEVLNATNVKATFFMVSELAAVHPEIVRDVAAAGHQVGLHGHRHTSFMFSSAVGAKRQLRQAKDIMEQIAQCEIELFRPPYGTLSASAIFAARANSLQIKLWTTWGKDWNGKSPNDVVQRIFNGRVDGGTVLLHDGDSPKSQGNWDVTAFALRMLCSRLRDQGLEPGPLSDH